MQWFQGSIVALLLLGTFGLRAWKLDQPIVENYVGRQVPTAMVARNLDRGSDFFHPELDTGPHPNLFLVEPPLYPLAVVGLRRATGLGLEPAGRLVSALGSMLACWGLIGLCRRREGFLAALAGGVAFALFPLGLRYGRAFQPDALMLGLVVSGLRCWDEAEASGLGIWRLAGWAAVAAGLALKVTNVFVLVPLSTVILRQPVRRSLPAVFSTLLPALAWYGYAGSQLCDAMGSRAARDNVAIWLGVLLPTALARLETYGWVVRFLVLRGFTPVGFLLGVVGWRTGSAACSSRLWTVWAASAGLTLVLLAGKLHHEYYWLALAVPLAAGVGRGWAALCRRGHLGRLAAGVLGAAFVGLAVVQASSTWRTPPEWEGLAAATAAIRKSVPPGTGLVAREAVLYYSDRRGCRLETTPGAVCRAAAEVGRRARRRRSARAGRVVPIPRRSVSGGPAWRRSRPGRPTPGNPRTLRHSGRSTAPPPGRDRQAEGRDTEQALGGEP